MMDELRIYAEIARVTEANGPDCELSVRRGTNSIQILELGVPLLEIALTTSTADALEAIWDELTVGFGFLPWD